MPDASNETSPPLLMSQDVQRHQKQSLHRLLAAIRGKNPFYTAKFASLPAEPELADLPFTTRAELQQDQSANPPYGTNLTEPLDRYCRFHQTSGTNGRPLRWLDTAESWSWFTDCWATIFEAANVGRSDRVLFPFSFGPFVGFWAAFHGAVKLGAMAIPAGGTSSQGRLQLIHENRVTAICCTPTYALHLAETARKLGMAPSAGSVKAIIVAGEPGGNIPEVRSRIEAAWGARVYDHHGMTEIGPVSFECRENPGGLHINEREFIAEVVQPGTENPVAEGEPGELILTNLGRTGSPLIRYRTGDQVRLTRGDCACGRPYARLVGGILGRVDDMFTVRGNNVFPTSVEAILRRFGEIAEFRLTVRGQGPLAEVLLEVEPTADAVDPTILCRSVAAAVHDELHFRAEVRAIEPGGLPRFEMKAKRFVRER